MTDSILNPDAEIFVPSQPWRTAYALMEEPPFVVLLKDVLYHLSTNPVAFSEYMSTIADAMNDTIKTDEQLRGVADVIFEQSTMEPNFTYTGARMCQYLVDNLRLPQDVTLFSTFINKRTKNVVVHRNEMLRAAGSAERVHGTTFFLAELFLMIEINVDGRTHRIYAYREALQELMEALISMPNTPNLKCAGKVVKMIGAAFDDFDRGMKNEESNRKFQQIFSVLKHLIVDEKVENKSVKLMWIELIELKASNWGRAVPPPISNEHVVTAGGDTGGAAARAISDEAVFYDADGQVISAGEAEANQDRQFEKDLEEFIAETDELDDLQNDFSELEIPTEEQYLPPLTAAESSDGDLMDPETEQAFEEFLQGFSSQSKPRHGYSSRHWSPNS